LRDALDANGYDVALCRTGGAAMAHAAAASPDLVLLDLGLPDADGVVLCRWLRSRHPEVPIVVVTARDADVDVVVGLDAGADDYVTKPFALPVLLARVRAHLRTTGVDAGRRITIGPLVVDRDAYRAHLDGQELDLRPKEFALLALLAGEAGRVVTRDRILAELWDLHWESSTKTLDMHVLALRRKLGDRDPPWRWISTVRGVGFRFELV
jgi:DNA-binding response OmpR family regulator